jgi:myo-inositol-1(or 4)-monophosphatase
VSTLSESIVSLDLSHDRQTRQSSIDFVQQAGNEISKMRLIGSAALSMAWLAAGRIEGYLNYRLQPWDVAAASVLVYEAGGQLTTPNGQPWRWSAGESGVVATNGRIHTQLLQLL